MKQMQAIRVAVCFLTLAISISLNSSFGQPFTGSNAPGGAADFSFEVSVATTNLSLTVIGSATAYSDLILKRGSPASDLNYDFIANLPGQTNSINLELPELQPGTYFLRVRTPAASAVHNFTVTFETNVSDMRSAARPVFKTMGTQFTSSIAAVSRQYFKFYLSSNAPIRVALDATNTSPDLYVQRAQIPTDTQYLKRSVGLTNDSVVMLETEATAGTYVVGVFSTLTFPPTLPFTLRLDPNPLIPLAWDPGTSHEGTLVYTNFSGTVGDYYFKITTANPSLGAWRTALKVLEGEANLYLSRGALPSTFQADFRSERTGSDGFVVSSSQFAPNEVWYVLVHANANAKWTLVSGAPYVQDLGTVAADASTGSGDVIIGPEGIRFFSARMPADMLAWRLWLNGASNSIFLKKTSLPLPANNELTQTGQMLVVPPYLAGGQQYFIGVSGNPGSTNNLDSRRQQIIDLAYGGSASNIVTGYPYTTYRVQVPAQQIAWQISVPSTNGNPNVAVRRSTVANENYNDALSELATAVTDNVTLVPPVLSDGTFYVTVWSAGPYQFTLQNGPAPVTPINYVDSVTNDDTNRVGWRFYRVTDINQQLGSLGWELALSNSVPGTRIALRRNAAPSTWIQRNPGPSTLVYYDLISIGDLLQQPGHQADVWYVGVYNPSNALGNFTLTAREISAQPLADSTPIVRTNRPPGTWEFFRIDVPATAGGNPVLGWDLRLTNVTGNPTLVLRRDAFPDSFSSTFPAPINVTNWPARGQWTAGVDWSGRQFPNVGTTNENGRILAMGMGRPLEPGTYYIGIQSAPQYPQASSYTLVSRWIGPGQPISIQPLNFAGDNQSGTVNPREANYYSLVVPPNKRSLKLHLTPSGGEVMLVASKDTLPNVTATGGNPIPNSAGRTVQKTGEEYLTILPPRGTNVLAPGTYYFAVVGEGQNPPDNSRIGTGPSSYVLQTLGELVETNIGLLGDNHLVTSGSLHGGEVAAYHFNTAPDVLGFWLTLEDRIGSPIAISRGGLDLADPGTSGQAIGTDLYGNEGGEQSGSIGGTYLTVSDPFSTETVMVKARAGTVPPLYPDASYTMRVDAIVPEFVAFDGGVTNVVGQDPIRGGYYYFDVPPNAAGWDIRLTNVTSGTPQLIISRDSLPIFTTTQGINPGAQTNWPTFARWAASRDWTERSGNPSGVSEDGRIIAMGMGRPLEPGRYYVSVLGQNNSTITPMSYTLVSRGIGDGFSIPVAPLAFNGGSLSANALGAREAAYFRVDVPTNIPSWKVRLSAISGEAMLVASKDSLPNVLVSSGSSLANSAGRKMQKIGDEYFLLLPPAGSNTLTAGTYYLAVVGEGVSPQPGRIATGVSDFVISSFGAAPVSNLGQLSSVDLVQTNSLAPGDTQIYQFTVPAGTQGLEARLDDRTNNPVMVLRQGAAIPDPGTGGGSVPFESYGHDGGETTAISVHPSFINIANPSNSVYTLVVMSRPLVGGIFTNASYTLRLNASGSVTLGFESDPFSITNQAPQAWKYYRVVVPTNALGWDLRLSNVTNGAPRLVIRRESLPNAFQTTPWGSPGSSTSWPTNYQWAPGQDWTHRSQSFADASISEDGRTFACGMGHPLEPGVYYVGVFNSSPTIATSYTIASRGIGPGFAIPVVDVPFTGTASGTLLPREAAYFRVIVPSNSPSWKVKLTGTSGESMLVALRGFVPNIDLNVPSGTLANGRGMQKPGNDHFLLLPANNTTNLPAGTNYFAVISEGVNPPSGSRIGNGSSAFTFESQGSISTNDLGLLTSEDLVRADTVEGGEVKMYQFTVPQGMIGFRVRLENRVGNPTFVLRAGDKIPDPGASVPASDAYGTEGGYASTDGGTTLYNVPNPVPGIYTLVVKGRAVGSSYPDASYTLRLQEILVPEVNFDPALNTNGILNTTSGVLDDNERVFYKFVIPSTNNGQALIGWKLDLAQSSGLATMRVRKDNLPTDANAAAQMPFTAAEAIIVPPFLTNGVWYVEVKGTGSTVFTLTSSPLLLERPVWKMPAPGEANEALGVIAPIFGDSGLDTNGLPVSADQSTFLQQGFLHYYAVLIPETNDGLLRAALEAISGNPDLYLRYGAAPTLSHNATGAGGTVYDRSMLANATEYANWVPVDGKLERKLKPGLWFMAVRAAGNANARYRLKLSVGTIVDIPLSGPDVTNQIVAGQDWRYYRFTAPATLPGGFNLSFTQQSGDVVVHIRDTVPPGNGITGANIDIKDWTTDLKNSGSGTYQSFDAPGTYSFAVPPVRPGATYYFGVRGLSDSVFSIHASTNGAQNTALPTINFYGGVLTTNLAPGAQLLYRIDVPAEATRWKHTAIHAAAVQLFMEQGTIPNKSATDDWRSNGAANAGLNQYLLSFWPWTPAQSYYLMITNTSSAAQDFSLTMDGKNALTDDNDADLLPDAWELLFFGNTTVQTGAGDADRDGVTNFDEYVDGTNPNDITSFNARLYTPATNGVVSRTPDLPNYPLNSKVTLIPVPAPGYAFVSWTSNAVGRTTPLSVTMDASKTIGAIFKLAGDEFITALPLVGSSASAVASNVSMTKEPGEPNHAGNPGGKSIWWRWTAPGSGPVTITTAGSSFNTLAAVYTGTSVSSLVLVASDNKSGGVTNRSVVNFNATAGTTYNIAVDGYDGASSRINISLSLASSNNVSLPPEFDGIAYANGRPQLIILGDPGRTYQVESTLDFTNWTPAGAITLDGTGKALFADPAQITDKVRFYRARQ